MAKNYPKNSTEINNSVLSTIEKHIRNSLSSFSTKSENISINDFIRSLSKAEKTVLNEKYKMLTAKMGNNRIKKPLEKDSANEKVDCKTEAQKSVNVFRIGIFYAKYL